LVSFPYKKEAGTEEFNYTTSRTIR